MLINAKVYSDGSHYIAIPHTTAPERKRKIINKLEQKIKVESLNKDNEIEIKETTKTELFNKLYEENKTATNKEKKEIIEKELIKHFEHEQDAKDFIEQKLESNRRNDIVRRMRFARKYYMNEFNYFVTFTYDNAKHTEESFRKSLRICLNNFHSRKGWNYMGVWERSSTDRLHFHGFIYVPDGAMVGELIKVEDYSFSTHKMQETMQNTYFNNRFGRNDFVEISEFEKKHGNLQGYLLKYITKSNDRIVYSRNLPTYIKSDILDQDILCDMPNKHGTKYVLTDNFLCIDDGEILGEMSNELKPKLKTNS